jgi:hypothetical protein
MIFELLAGIVLAGTLFAAFRFAMGLRWARLTRERALSEELERGRRLVAEVPTPSGEIELFLEDESGFYWAGAELGKRDLLGARLLLNGAVMRECRRPGSELPEASTPEEYEGRERWEVAAYRPGGDTTLIACGSLREGVSREAARDVFEALESACVAPAAGAPGSEERQRP